MNHILNSILGFKNILDTLQRPLIPPPKTISIILIYLSQIGLIALNR